MVRLGRGAWVAKGDRKAHKDHAVLSVRVVLEVNRVRQGCRGLRVLLVSQVRQALRARWALEDRQDYQAKWGL